jgi:hypothetical protein
MLPKIFLHFALMHYFMEKNQTSWAVFARTCLQEDSFSVLLLQLV